MGILKWRATRKWICSARISSASGSSASPLRNLVVKQVIAIVRPFLAEKVLENLKRAPLEALCVQEVKGFGRQKSYLNE
ncbi:MAG: P-II family nitrogen regulator, partial [Planctomycetota bacterium]